MASETSETECEPRVSNRGKNFSVAEDKQICLSWIHASDICNQSSSSNIYIWGILYNHAVSKEKAIESRTASGLRHRFLSIQREARKFSDIYDICSKESESVVENALQTYKSKYKVHFKFLHCWEILSEYPKFQKLAETHSSIIKASIQKKEMEDPEFRNPSSSLSESARKKSRGINVLPDEIQALLKACHDIGVEDARSKGERIEPLMYDVQQQMAIYGRFPERKLYVIKKQYIRTEKNYRNGDLVPYPPEARILWGKIDKNKDDEFNDARWDQMIQGSLDHRKGLSFLSDLEIRELFKEALRKNVESISQAKRMIIFHDILSTLHTKKLCRRKNAEQLLEDYLRLKKQFSTGRCKSLPPEANQLFTLNDIKTEPVEEETESRLVENVPMKMSFTDCSFKTEFVDVCRICQAELLDETKDLFLDVYNGETYAAIIKETLNVEMMNDGLRSTVICSRCSTFIENVVYFVQQCRGSCITKDSLAGDITFGKHEIVEFDVTLMPNDTLKETNNQISVNDINDDNVDDDDDYIMNEDDILEEVSETMNKETGNPEAILNEDKADEELDEETRRKRNYRKYVDSRKSSHGPQRQCHLCGKKVIGLTDHLESHSGKEFKCHVCDWVCPNRRQLRIHMNRHTKKHIFPCRHCDKIFYVWSSRKNHEDTHTQPAYKCDLCDMEYRHKSYLLAHKRAKHLGIRNLKCTQCEFSTFIKARLLNHVRSMHTTERPYKCSVCEQTANSSSGYYIHFQRHKKSGEVVDYSINCAYCNEQFTKDASLEVHIVKSHPDKAVKI